MLLTRSNVDTIILLAHKELAAKQAALLEERRVFVELLSPWLEKIQTLPSWGHVQLASLYVDEEYPGIGFSLAVKDSPFAREMTSLLGVTGEKSPSWDGVSLTVLWKVPREGKQPLTIRVNGYLPAGCRTVKRTRYVAAKTEEYSVVECGPGEDSVGEGVPSAAEDV